MTEETLKETPKIMLEPRAFIKSQLNEVVDKFVKEHEGKSFSGRHPELGKMINCGICNLRHRSVQACEQRHVVELTPPEGLTELTKKQYAGAAAFKGKRTRPHRSKRKLQLLEYTMLRFPSHNGIWPSTQDKTTEQVAMEVARREARSVLSKVERAARSVLQSMQSISRRINRGLLQGNSKNRL